MKKIGRKLSKVEMLSIAGGVSDPSEWMCSCPGSPFQHTVYAYDQNEAETNADRYCEIGSADCVLVTEN